MSSAPVPESLLKKRKRDDAWRANKHAANAVAALKAKEKRKVIFKKAEAYVKQYRQQVRCALGRVICVCVHALSGYLVARSWSIVLIIIVNRVELTCACCQSSQLQRDLVHIVATSRQSSASELEPLW
jgi:hypothetical protein